MKNKIVNFFKDNSIPAFDKYPGGQTPLNFVTIEFKNISPEGDVKTYDFDITVYSREDLESFLEQVYDLLTEEIHDIAAIGNVTLDYDEAPESKSTLKSQIIKLTFDRIKYYEKG